MLIRNSFTKSPKYQEQKNLMCFKQNVTEITCQFLGTLSDNTANRTTQKKLEKLNKTDTMLNFSLLQKTKAQPAAANARRFSATLLILKADD